MPMSSRWAVAALLAALLCSPLVLPTVAAGQTAGVYLDGAESWVASDCTGDIPVVVASDAKAQSDIYSAVTLASSVPTDCVILAGPRDGPMSASQRARLDAAATNRLDHAQAPNGYVLGGLAAVPESKLAGRAMTRIAGADRWATADIVGNHLDDPGHIPINLPSSPDHSLTLPADVGAPGLHLDGAEPWVASDCGGKVPIVVGSDAPAQSDIYSAVTLAGIVGTDCIVLAGPRDGPMPSSQRARLAAAAPKGCVVGGRAAIPDSKVAGRDMRRISGQDRWATAALVAGTISLPCGAVDGLEFGADTLSGASYRAAFPIWSRNARGDLRVRVHVCTEPDYVEDFTAEDIQEFVDHLNEVEAPFYSWQSSGLLSVRFEAGPVIASDDVERGIDFRQPGGGPSPPWVPHDCRIEPASDSPLVHHYLLYGDDLKYHNPGAAGPCGPSSVSILLYNPHREPSLFVSDPMGYIETSRSSSETVHHELDHNICVGHLNGVQEGATRECVGEGSCPAALGTLDGYPDALRAWVPEVYPCYELVRMGWPAGDGHPACSLVPLPAPKISAFAQATPQGSVSIAWQLLSPFRFNTEPVKGHVVELYEGSAGTPAKTHRVSAATSAFLLPQTTIDALDSGVEYRVEIAAEATFGPGERGYAGSFTYRDNRASIDVSQRPSSLPLAYDLSWEPDPAASHYLVTGFERCKPSIADSGLPGPFCIVRTDEPAFTLSEDQRNQVVAGETYEIIVFACGTELGGPGEAVPPTPRRDCVVHGKVAFTAKRWAPEGGLQSVRPVLVSDLRGNENHSGEPLYRFEFGIHPDATGYVFALWQCIDSPQPPCDQGRTTLSTIQDTETELSGPGLFLGDTTVTSSQFLLERGRYYRMEAYHSCTTPDDLDSCADSLYAQSTFTVPTTDN